MAVTVEEGLIDPDTGSGRHWKVVVANRAQAIADDKEKKAAEKQVGQGEETVGFGDPCHQGVGGQAGRRDREGVAGGGGCQQGATIKPVLRGLLLCGTIEECKVGSTRRPTMDTGWKVGRDRRDRRDRRDEPYDCPVCPSRWDGGTLVYSPTSCCWRLAVPSAKKTCPR